MKKTTILLIIISSFLFVCYQNQPPPQESQLEKYENLSVDAGFDTIYAYTEYGYDHNKMKEHFDQSVSLFSRYDNYFDIYNNVENLNNLKTINDQAGIAPVGVDQEIIDLLKQAKFFYDISDGQFDITMGATLQVWHKYREVGMELNASNQLAPVPPKEELEATRACRGWDKIEIDEEKQTVYINDPCVSLDVGGIAKGYATERIAEIIEPEVEYGSLNAGRNIRTLNVKPNDAPWRIGLVNPKGESSLMTIDTKVPSSFVTSGDYERFFIGEDNISYHHIINPTTLYPSDDYHSVTIITKDSGAADCLSTTLFSMSIENGKKVLERYTQETGEKAYAVWMMDADKTQNCEGKLHHEYFIVYSSELEEAILWN